MRPTIINNPHHHHPHQSMLYSNRLGNPTTTSTYPSTTTSTTSSTSRNALVGAFLIFILLLFIYTKVILLPLGESTTSVITDWLFGTNSDNNSSDDYHTNENIPSTDKNKMDDLVEQEIKQHHNKLDTINSSPPDFQQNIQTWMTTVDARLDELEQVTKRIRADIVEEISARKEVSSKMYKLNDQVEQVHQELLEVEDAMIVDGSASSMAVAMATLTSSSGNVRSCDWPRCGLETMEESITSLLTRISTPVSKKSSLTISIIYLLGSCNHLQIFGKIIQNQFTIIRTKKAQNCSISSSSNDATTNNNNNNMGGGGQDEIITDVLKKSFSLPYTASSFQDKSLLMVFYDGSNNDESTNPILGEILRDWTPKLAFGGIFVGTGYSVERPFAVRMGRGTDYYNSKHQIATRTSLETFRKSDDNIGQDETVNVAGGGIWYFTKVRPKLGNIGRL
jgi:hypothetical protein